MGDSFYVIPLTYYFIHLEPLVIQDFPDPSEDPSRLGSGISFMGEVYSVGNQFGSLFSADDYVVFGVLYGSILPQVENFRSKCGADWFLCNTGNNWGGLAEVLPAGFNDGRLTSEIIIQAGGFEEEYYPKNHLSPVHLSEYVLASGRDASLDACADYLQVFIFSHETYFQ